MRVHSREVRNRAIALYASGLSARAVSMKLRRDRHLEITPQTIARWARQLGLSRPVGDTRRIELDESAKRLYESGSNLDQVARRVGVGKTTVRKRLLEMGVTIRPSGSRFVHVLAKERLEELYLRKGLTMKQIADRYGCSIGTVHRLLRVHSVSRKSR